MSSAVDVLAWNPWAFLHRSDALYRFSSLAVGGGSFSMQGGSVNPATMPINTGNTGFMLLCSSLVMLMTPGLAFFWFFAISSG